MSAARDLAARVGCIGGFMLIALHAAAQPPRDTPANVRRLAESGARTLAMQRLEFAQPKLPDAPAWLEWERLRLDMLAVQGGDESLLGRVRDYPPAVMTLPGTAALYLHGARAALRLGDAGQARLWLTRAFGHPGAESLIADGMAYRAARLAVIDAYLAAAEADAAYRSMLRFQQDFTPLRSEEVERFVAGLAALDRYGDAANWLAQLEPRSSYAALLRLRAGLLSADAAVGQARAALGQGRDAGALALLESVARLQSNRALSIEVAELRLAAALAEGIEGQRIDAGTDALWQRYLGAAEQVANQAQLLTGDDAAWHRHAVKLLPGQSHLARALLAYLASRSSHPGLRADAQHQLILTLKDAKLAPVALALFADRSRFSIEALDTRVRHELGDIAAEARHPRVALAYWHAVTPPARYTLEQWQVRRLGVMLDAERIDEAAALAHELLLPERVLSTEARQRLLAIALDALARYQLQPAEILLDALRGRAPDAERFAVLDALARCYEAKGEARQAAATYLEAAASVVLSEADRDALRAREAAAAQLLKAGLREDARSVYEWLARHAKEAGARESAARAVARLKSLPDR